MKFFKRSTSAGKCHSTGSSTLEVAFVVAATGALLLVSIAAFNAFSKMGKRSTTEQRIETVMDALSAYALRNYRIPCPANPAGAGPEPFGTERGSGAAGTNIGACAGNLVDGIVPYLTLGLSEEYARDGWGNFITYKVSRAFTYDPENNATTVHAKCRTTEWIEAGRNIALQKARFCCSNRDTADDLTVCQNPVTPCPNQGAWPLNRNTVAAWYAGPDTPALPTDASAANPISFGAGNPYYAPNFYASNVANTTNITTIAYVLISHGENEHGAFLNNGNRQSDPDGDGVPDRGGTFERLNGNATLRVAWDLPLDARTGAPNFDDIVRFSTQDMLLARQGRNSCAIP